MKALSTALLFAVAGQARAAQPCDALAAYALKAPAAAWATGSDEALKGVLTYEAAKDNPTGAAASVAASAKVREAVGAEEGEPPQVQRLPGTDIYMASSIQGTLHCQTSAFAEAAPGKPVRLTPGPAQSEELCWTQSADLGRVLGQPAYVEHGTLDQETADEDILITPWAGRAWAPACRLSLRFRIAFPRIERHCGEAAACAAADKAVDALAAAYNHWPSALRQTGQLWFGPRPSAAALATLKRTVGSHQETETPDFPTFARGKGPTRQFSYSGFAYAPVRLEGQDYIAAVGHEGVGWREGDVTLLAVYRAGSGPLKPVASYAFRRTVLGLASAVSAKPGAPGQR